MAALIYNTILLIFLLFSIQGFSQGNDYIDKIKNDEFGKTLLQTVQVQLKASSSPFKKIENLLVSMEDQISSESNKDTAESQLYQKDCSKNTQLLQSVISSLSDEIKTSINTIADKNVKKDVKENDLSSKQLTQGQKVRELESLTDRRKNEKNVYENESDEINRALSVIRDGIKVLQAELFKIQSSSETLFLSRRPSSIPESKIALVSLDKKFKTLNPKESGIFMMINAFGQIMISASEKTKTPEEITSIENYMETLTILKNKLEEDGGNLLQIELKRREIFELEIKAVKDRLKGLENEIKQLEEEIVALKQEINGVEIQKNNNEVKVKEKSKELKDTEKSCFDYQTSFELRDKKRRNQLEIINQLLSLFRASFGETSEYVEGLDLNT